MKKVKKAKHKQSTHTLLLIRPWFYIQNHRADKASRQKKIRRKQTRCMQHALTNKHCPYSCVRVACEYVTA